MCEADLLQDPEACPIGLAKDISRLGLFYGPGMLGVAWCSKNTKPADNSLGTGVDEVHGTDLTPSLGGVVLIYVNCVDLEHYLYFVFSEKVEGII